MNGPGRLLPLLLLFTPALVPDQSGSTKPGVQPPFVDVTAAAKISFVHKSGATPDKFMYETFGSGVAWIDYDNDGFPDLFLVNGAPGSPNALYHNNGDGTFTDVTAKAGVAGGDKEWSTSTGFFDYDHDGDLDLYVTNYLDYRVDDNPYCGFRKEGYRMYCNPTTFDGMADRLFRNNGDGTFTDVSKQAGIANPAGKGLGVVFCDYDRDGDTDIYVANDMVRNFLYRNNGNGTFTDVAYGAGVGFDLNGKTQAGMGVDCADVNGDKLPDLFVTNFSDELNTLYLNQGNGVFEDVTTKIGLGSGFEPLGFGTKLFDFDNDGDNDIYVTNGHVADNIQLYQKHTYAQKDLLYENLGGRFRDISSESGPALQALRVGRGLAVADFDNDGALDIAISSVGRPAVLLKNEAGSPGSWITIRAQGTKSNRFGLGATVTVETSGGVQVGEINNVASYQSSNDIRAHFGLGTAKTIKQLEIAWPGGTKQILKDVAVNQILTVKEE